MLHTNTTLEARPAGANGATTTRPKKPTKPRKLAALKPLAIEAPQPAAPPAVARAPQPASGGDPDRELLRLHALFRAHSATEVEDEGDKKQHVAWIAKQTELLCDMVRLPASTPEGVRAKADIIAYMYDDDPTLLRARACAPRSGDWDDHLKMVAASVARDLLAGLVTPGAPSEGDLALLALAPRLEAALVAERAARSAALTIRPGDADHDEKDAAATAAEAELEAAVAATMAITATTLAGLKVKARAAEIMASQMSDQEDDVDLDVRAMRRLVGDVLAFSGAGDEPAMSAGGGIRHGMSPAFRVLHDEFREAVLTARRTDIAAVETQGAPESDDLSRQCNDANARSMRAARDLCGLAAESADDVVLQIEAADLMMQMAMDCSPVHDTEALRSKVVDAWRALTSVHALASRALVRVGGAPNLWPTAADCRTPGPRPTDCEPLPDHDDIVVAGDIFRRLVEETEERYAGALGVIQPPGCERLHRTSLESERPQEFVSAMVRMYAASDAAARILDVDRKGSGSVFNLARVDHQDEAFVLLGDMATASTDAYLLWSDLKCAVARITAFMTDSSVAIKAGKLARANLRGGEA